MQTDSLELSTRVQVLERRFRRLGLLAGLALVTLTTAAFMPSGHEPVRATSFELVDDSGTVRGRWAVAGTAGPRFELLDQETGKALLEVSIRGQKSFLRFRDVEGHSRLALTVDERGNPHVVLLDGLERPRFHTAIGVSGWPNLLMKDEEGHTLAGLGVMPDGQPWARPGHDEAWPSEPSGGKK